MHCVLITEEAHAEFDEHIVDQKPQLDQLTSEHSAVVGGGEEENWLELSNKDHRESGDEPVAEDEDAAGAGTSSGRY